MTFGYTLRLADKKNRCGKRLFITNFRQSKYPTANGVVRVTNKSQAKIFNYILEFLNLFSQTFFFFFKTATKIKTISKKGTFFVTRHLVYVIKFY